jgi:4-cresol dehydrogenase (hydroxylating) flavoprotein subunit
MELSQAIATWKEQIGHEYVLTDQAIRNHYARSTQPQGTYPLAVLRPANTNEVCKIVRTAVEYAVPIYPISRGRNWGYGDACAVTDDQVIVDLSRMNQIHEINQTLAYAVIEPGVTQGQLYEALAHTSLWMDVTGAGTETSVLGNTLERGFGHMPYGDHFQMSAGYEVVLSDGRVMTTGFGHYDAAKTTYLYKAGVGATLDGLFTQSNLGIVTKMGVWLMPKPKYVQGVVFSVPQEDDIAPLVDALRPLRLSGVLQSTVHIGNDLRVISSNRQYPWSLTQGKTPLPDEVRETLRRQLKIGAWVGSGALYGTQRTVATARHEIKRALRGIARLQFFDQSLLSVARSVTARLPQVEPLKRFNDRIKAAQSALDLLTGVPTSQYLNGAGWRSTSPPLSHTLDPLENNWGLFWLAPVLPMTGDAVLDLLKLVEPEFRKYQFEPQITLSSVNPRALCGIITITYNKQDPNEVEQAIACYQSLFTIVMQNGYIPYRVGIQSMHDLAEGSTVFWQVIQQIKTALDPGNILSPGRYNPILIE